METRRRTAKNSHGKGFTLIEVLVSITIMVFIFAGTRGLVIAGVRNWSRLGQVQELQVEAARLAAMMTRDIRQATSITGGSVGTNGSALWEVDTLAAGPVTMNRPFTSDPDVDTVVRKDTDYWYESRQVTYSLDPDDAKKLIRQETITWKKVADPTVTKTWSTYTIMTKNLKRVAFYQYRPSSESAISGEPYRMYVLRIALQHRGPNLVANRVTKFEIKQVVYQRQRQPSA